MPKLAILSGIYHPEPGGPATYLHELLPALLERGWEVRALSFADRVPDPPLYEPVPVTRIVRSALPVRMARYYAAARPLLAWADVAYLHTLGLPLPGSRIPRIVKIVGDQAWERAVRRGWIGADEDIDAYQTKRYTGAKAAFVHFDRARRTREARALDGVIVPSGYLRDMVVGWGVPAERVQVVYNALPAGAAEAAAPSTGDERAALRRALGLPDAPVVLTVGRILPWKGVDHLITALSRARGAARDAHLVVAGDGALLPALRAQADAAGLSARVHFLGRVGRAQVDRLMRAAEYTALYSGYEGLSHTLLESLRAATPVIASRKGGNPEVVADGVNGLLVPYIEADALADALDRALAPGVRERLAQGHGVGMERFTFARMVADTDAALRQAAERGR
jgi:glycosyltransferase involved in cell wall biosynthesis